ncbi:MAG: hypothetical protein ACRDJ1_06575 [Actinomycetota bacterium]
MDAVSEQDEEARLVNRLESQEEVDYRYRNDFYAGYGDEWGINVSVRPPQYKSVRDALRDQCHVGETTLEVYECETKEISGTTLTWCLPFTATTEAATAAMR